MFPEKKKRISWWAIVLILLFVGAAGASGYFGVDYYQKKQSEKNKKAEEPAKETAPDPYAGWKTYTNNDIGYTLKYPADWTYKETNQISEITQQLVKYVAFISPQKSSLHLGLRKAGDDSFNTTDRTGIGAGEDKPIAEKASTFLGEKITPKAHVWDGKVGEYFFDLTGGACGCDTTLWFGLENDIDWATQAKTWSELDTVGKIFASASWLASDDSAGSETNLNKAKGVVSKYLDARMTRDLENAKPYMTQAFISAMNQEKFAGVSSPSMGKYSDLSAKYLSNADLYQVTATIHWFLQNEESGTSVWTLNVVNESGKFLVNEVNGSYE